MCTYIYIYAYDVCIFSVYIYMHIWCIYNVYVYCIIYTHMDYVYVYIAMNLKISVLSKMGNSNPIMFG